VKKTPGSAEETWILAHLHLQNFLHSQAEPCFRLDDKFSISPSTLAFTVVTAECDTKKAFLGYRPMQLVAYCFFVEQTRQYRPVEIFNDWMIRRDCAVRIAQGDKEIWK